jgi:hypothetical protein
VLLFAGCKKADDCERAANALLRVMKDAPVPTGKSVGDLKDAIVSSCRKDPEAFKKDKDMQCVIAAKSEGEENACLKAAFEDYAHKSKKSEAALQLNAIGKKAKVVFVEKGAFPIGKAKPLPATPDPSFKGCCGGKSAGSTVDNKCPVTADWTSDPVWQALMFQIDEPTSYRYTYESTDGKSFKATAAGDLDCDNQEAVFTLTGTIDAGGNPEVTLEKPATGVY